MAEARSPGGRQGPIAASLEDLLARLQQGRGGVLLVSGGTPSERELHLRTLAEGARARRMHAERLEATTWDQEVPFGAILPWLARVRALRHSAPGPGERGTRSSPDEAWLPSVLLAGLPSPQGTPGRPRERTPRVRAYRAAPERHDVVGVAEPERPVVETMAGENPASTPPVGLGESDMPVVAPDEVRTILLDLMAAGAPGTPTLVTLDHAELLDLASRDWLRQISHELEHLPLFFSLAFDEEHETFTEWKAVVDGARLDWHRLPGRRMTRREGAPPPMEELRSLSREARLTLAAVGAAGSDAREALLGEALGARTSELAAELDGLAAQGWVLPFQGGWRVASETVAERASDSLEPSERRELFRVLAVAMEKRHPHPTGAALFRIGDLWALANASEPGVDRLLESARECALWGSVQLAERRIARALVLAQNEPSARGRRLEETVLGQLGALRRLSNDFTGAIDPLRRALRLAQARGAPVTKWAPYVAGIAQATAGAGGDPEGELRTTMERVRGQDAEAESLLGRTLAEFLLWHGRPQEAVEVAERAEALSREVADVRSRLISLVTLANVYLFSGGDSGRAREFYLEALKLRGSVEGTWGQSRIASALEGLAMSELIQGRYPQALMRAEEAVRESRRVGFRDNLLSSLGNAAECACSAGDLRRAEELTGELRRLCERYRMPEVDQCYLQLLLVEGFLAWLRGELGRAQERLQRLSTVAERAGTRYFVAQSLLFQALVAETGERHDEVHRLLREMQRANLAKILAADYRARFDALVIREAAWREA